MKTFRLISLLLIATLCLGACSTHDPVYDDPTPPSDNISKITLCGTVWDKSGNEIKDATIAIDGVFSVKTDEHGWYSQEIQAGNYVVKCSAEGKENKSSELEAIATKNDEIYIRNFVLPAEASVTFTKDTEAEVQTDVIDGNLNGIVTFNGLSEEFEEDDDCAFVMSPMYDEGSATGYNLTKGPRNTGVCQMLLCGVKIKQTKGDKKRKVTIKANLNKESQEVIDILYSADGQNWAAYNGSIKRLDDKVILEKAPEGCYGFFADVTVNHPEKQVPLEVKPSLLDNLFGVEDIVGAACVYEYTSGVVIDTKQGTVQLRALLLELLAADYGLKDKLSTHTLYFEQPVKMGWACQLSATQLMYAVTYACQTSLAYREVEGDMCDKAKIEEVWYNRKHTGGGGGN